MKKTLWIAASALMLTSAPLLAGDAAAGKAKYAACGGCHGANGISPSPANPSLAGKSADEIVAALNEYKSGARNNATMKAMASGLSDDDIANIAAYVATLKP
jgi:cytochrome c553